MNNTCCLDCKERHAHCHSECEKYKKFKQELEILNEKIRKQKNYQRSSSFLASVKKKMMERK